MLGGRQTTFERRGDEYLRLLAPHRAEHELFHDFVTGTGPIEPMAVVADPEDGTNPSKVYIAADGPLTVNSLPIKFDNAISFLRVVPWINPLKKGFGGANDPPRSKDHQLKQADS